MLGDTGTGQSEFLRAYRSSAGGEVPDAQIENMVAVVELDNEAWCVRFTDNVGHPRCNTLRPAALRIAHVVLLCFRVDDQESLQGVISKWLPCLRESKSEAPFFLVGLKADTRVRGGDGPLVDQEQCRDLAQRCGALDYLECTAVHPETVQQVVDEALAAAQEYYSLQWQLSPDAGLASAEASGKSAEAEEAWLEHERLNVPDDPRPLEPEALQKNLSMLGRTFTRQHAYLRLDIAGLGLTSIDSIRPFVHLQFVNVSRNQLRTLEPLGVLRCMLHLNASFNLLIRTQSFTAPDGLITCDMSHNMIGELGDWGVHKYLRELNLRGNFISEIGPGLKSNKELRMLDLSENHITRIEQMDGLDLSSLHLAQNQLDSLDGVSSLRKLQVLNVRHNNITSVAALQAEDIPRIRKLDISDNRISHIREVAGLQSFTFLCDLQLAPNPVVELPHYRAQVLHRLPRLRSLDAQAVPAEEKVKADLIYGVDVDKRDQIFQDLLPNEPFVDRRLVTDEGIAAAELEQFGVQGNAGNYGGAGLEVQSNNMTFAPAGAQAGNVRTRMQDAKYRQRLDLAQRGGEPAGEIDFETFAAPFVSVRISDAEILEVLEACLEGGIECLKLGGCSLSAAGVREIVSMMREGHSHLRHVSLKNCAAVGDMGPELLSTVPLDHGCSLETAGCGLRPQDAETLRNNTPEAEAALQHAAKERKRTEVLKEAYMKAQEALEREAAEECDRDTPPPPPPLLCHPLKWPHGINLPAQASFKAFRSQNASPASSGPLEVTKKSGEKVVISPDERLALCRQRDQMLREAGAVLPQYEDDEGEGEEGGAPPSGRTLGGKPLPPAFEEKFPAAHQNEDLLAFMVWEGVDPDAGVVAGIRHKRQEWEAAWRERAAKRHELSHAAAEQYDSEDAPMHVSSGQLIAHFTYLCYQGNLPGGADALKLYSQFGLKHLAEAPRPDPRRGVDLHRALADGLVLIESVTGRGFGNNSLELKLSSDADVDMEIAVRRGTIFQQVGWQHRQNLMVAFDHVLFLPAQGSTMRSMNAFCLNLLCALPNGNPMALTEFYLDDDETLASQGNVWDYFEELFAMGAAH